MDSIKFAAIQSTLEKENHYLEEYHIGFAQNGFMLQLLLTEEMEDYAEIKKDPVFVFEDVNLLMDITSILVEKYKNQER